MAGEEGLSRLSSFRVDLVSENHEINLDKLIGQPAAVRLALGAGKGGNRYFHGIISRFRQLPEVDRYARYRAEIVPWLWLLTRTSDCRIFQKLTVPEILEGRLPQTRVLQLRTPFDKLLPAPGILRPGTPKPTSTLSAA